MKYFLLLPLLILGYMSMDLKGYKEARVEAYGDGCRDLMEHIVKDIDNKTLHKALRFCNG
jgi:hypothetical protein